MSTVMSTRFGASAGRSRPIASPTNAVPIQTLLQLAGRHRVEPTTTVSFVKRERDGWETECFEPSWYAFDGSPGARPPAAPRVGSDAPAILAELGYPPSDVERLISEGVVGPTEWFRDGQKA